MPFGKNTFVHTVYHKMTTTVASPLCSYGVLPLGGHPIERAIVLTYRMSWTSRSGLNQMMIFCKEGSSSPEKVISDCGKFVKAEMEGLASGAGWHDPGFRHHVLFHAIPGKRYLYRLGSLEDGWTDSLVMRIPTLHHHRESMGPLEVFVAGGTCTNQRCYLRQWMSSIF